VDKETHSEGREAALQKKQQREEKARERKEQREQAEEQLEERKQIRQEERRNASGSVRKHGVSRRAPHEQEGPGVLAASALLLFASIHLSAWKTEPPSVRLQGTKNSRAAARG
jgi:hypothetical protein